jgi:hypothetical protein
MSDSRYTVYQMKYLQFGHILYTNRIITAALSPLALRPSRPLLYPMSPCHTPVAAALLPPASGVATRVPARQQEISLPSSNPNFSGNRHPLSLFPTQSLPTILHPPPLNPQAADPHIIPDQPTYNSLFALSSLQLPPPLPILISAILNIPYTLYPLSLLQ